MCTHGRKQICKICGGNAYCIHNKIKQFCKTCGGSRLCKSDWCEVISNKKYNGYCLRCCIYLYPETEAVKNYKTKEKDVVDRVIKYYPNFTWINDKVIKDGNYKNVEFYTFL